MGPSAPSDLSSGGILEGALMIRKMLIADRGEIAADEAFALGGTAPFRGTTPGPPAEKRVSRGGRCGQCTTGHLGMDGMHGVGR